MLKKFLLSYLHSSISKRIWLLAWRLISFLFVSVHIPRVPRAGPQGLRHDAWKDPIWLILSPLSCIETLILVISHLFMRSLWAQDISLAVFQSILASLFICWIDMLIPGASCCRIDRHWFSVWKSTISAPTCYLSILVCHHTMWAFKKYVYLQKLAKFGQNFRYSILKCIPLLVVTNISYVSAHQELFGEIYRIPPSQVAAWVNKQNWQRALISAIAVCGASLSKLACQIGVIMPSGVFGSVWTQRLQLARKTNDSRDSRGDKATLVAVKILPKSFIWSLLPRTLLPRTCVPSFKRKSKCQHCQTSDEQQQHYCNLCDCIKDVVVFRLMSCQVWARLRCRLNAWESPSATVLFIFQL